MCSPIDSLKEDEQSCVRLPRTRHGERQRHTEVEFRWRSRSNRNLLQRSTKVLLSIPFDRSPATAQIQYCRHIATIAACHKGVGRQMTSACGTNSSGVSNSAGPRGLMPPLFCFRPVPVATNPKSALQLAALLVLLHLIYVATANAETALVLRQRPRGLDIGIVPRKGPMVGTTSKGT